MNRRNRPDRAIVLRIAQEEAGRHNADPSRVLSMAFDRASVQARRSAMRRVIAETGCSRSGLAAVWGCDRQVVCRLFNPPSRRERIAKRERAENGDVRSSIIAGQIIDDDLAAWRNLGRGSRAA